MTNSIRYISKWLASSLALCTLLLMTSCQKDAADDTFKASEGIPLKLTSVTRAGTETTRVESGTIKMFVMAPDEQYSQGSYNYNGGWKNNGVYAMENTQYYLYGYMPGDKYNGSVSKPAGKDYAAGADLTLTGLPLLTTEDICVLVGVQRFASVAPESPANEGSYSYLSGLAEENNVNMLMDHLYCQLRLKFNIGKEYYEIRRIHLKSVKLKATYDDNVTATIQLRDKYGLASHVTYSAPTANPTPLEFDMLKAGDTELSTLGFVDLPSEESTPFTINRTVLCPHCLFNDGAGAYLSVECTYDVYDTDTYDSTNPDRHRMRKDCKATNKINITGMGPGTFRTLTLTIAPTYLYVLGDDDANNPPIVIN